MRYCSLFCLILVLLCVRVFGQQDVDFHITSHLLPGKKIIKVKRDFYDPYLWVLAQNNEVYRINSLSLSIDDYSAKFGAYSQDTIIDIAGHTPDSLYAATSTKILGCFYGTVQQTTLADNINKPINSIGISNFSGGGTYFGLFIGTDRNGYVYRFDNHQFNQVTNNNEYTRVFEATYRSLMYTDYNTAYDTDPTHTIPVVYFVPYSGYQSHLLKSGPFGQQPNTAFFTPRDISSPGYPLYLFWGNDNGFFQIVQPVVTFYDNDWYAHYLDGIKVNKITDIIGLSSFFVYPGYSITKRNLLVGTANGLYFSNDVFANYSTAMFHYDPMGNIPVNDICVNGTATQANDVPLGCENGVWVGTDDGLYLLSPDYGKYVDPHLQVKDIYFDVPGIADTVSSLKICEGSSVPIAFNPYHINGNSIQWKKNGQDIVGQTGNQLSISDSGEYSAVVYSPCENVHIETNHLKVSTIAGPVFSFNYPDKLQYCDSTSVTLRTDYSNNYHYRWYTNDTLNGDTTAVLKAIRTAKYKVEVSACTNTWIPSKQVEVDLANLPVPQITANKPIYCQGDTAIFSSGIAISPDYTLNWYRDNVLLDTFNNKASIKTTVPGDYTVSVISNIAACSKTSAIAKLFFTASPVFAFNYADKIQQCNSTSYTLKTDTTPGYRYRWYSNGTLNSDTSISFTVTQTGKYKLEVSACANSWVPSKEVEVDLITLPVPQVLADKQVYCAGDNAKLVVNVPVDNSYSINWYLNGTLLPDDKDLTSITVIPDGSYTATVNSTISDCSQTSAPLQLAFTPSPVFTFNYPDILRYCTAMPLTLTVSGNAAYSYRWYTNGVLNGQTTTNMAITQPGKYKVEVSACAGSWVPSKEVQVDFVNLPVPVIIADKPAYCIGDNAIFSVPVPQDTSYTVNWYRDNLLLTANTNQYSITTNIAGNYTVEVLNHLKNTDGTVCSQTSANKQLQFNPPLTVSIEKIVKSTICDGQVIYLLAHYSGGTVKWSTGETADKIGVTTPGTYTVAITSSAGCTADASIDVSFLPNPVFSVKDTSICTYKREPVTLIAPSGFAQYTWNGQSGTQTYAVNQPQTVNLTITDANGCQTTQAIKVTEHCPDIWIPNTFTPNGDGINDTWNIQGLDNDQTVLVRVFSRYGSLIYESKGYGIPWNGEYGNKKLPTGTYYYIVSAKNGTQKFSGYIAIIY